MPEGDTIRRTAAALQPAVAFGWMWRFLVQLFVPSSAGDTLDSILGTLPAEMLLGPMLLVWADLGLHYRSQTIHGQEWARARAVERRKKALERGWQGPNGDATGRGWGAERGRGVETDIGLAGCRVHAGYLL